eukprot:3478177-Pleurochrysis_carterae.AAC.1
MRDASHAISPPRAETAVQPTMRPSRLRTRNSTKPVHASLDLPNESAAPRSVVASSTRTASNPERPSSRSQHARDIPTLATSGSVYTTRGTFGCCPSPPKHHGKAALRAA